MSSEGIKTLVADAGSTKTTWGVAGCGVVAVTAGLNALTSSDRELAEVIEEARGIVGSAGVGEIHWYGAGCATAAACRRVKTALESAFAPEAVWVGSDLAGAARALFGRGKGIACILGTGSNSGYYDGLEIAGQVPSLGYILGDEGSGAAMGRRLLAGVLRGKFARSLSEELRLSRGVDMAGVLERIYRQEAPNRYLASFVPFLAAHESDAAVQELVVGEFSSFAERVLTAYPQIREVPVGFVGSVAWRFGTLLEKALGNFGLKVDRIIKDPMEGLLRYHA